MASTKYEKSLIFIFFLLAIYASLFYYQNWKVNKEIERQELVKQQQLEQLRDKLSSLELQAKAVSVYDVNAGEEIYGENNNLVLPIASLAKIMTVLVALNNYSSEDTINISLNALMEDGDNGLNLAEKWKVSDLAKFTLTLSSNDGAVALSEQDPNFIDKMNAKAIRLGLNNTHFDNVTGLDINDEAYGAVSTAKEINELAIFALHANPEIFSATIIPEAVFTSLSGTTHKILNTNTIVSEIPNIMVSKTGNTDLAGGSLLIIFNNVQNRPIAVSVLGSTILGRFTDMEKIVEVLYNEGNEDIKN